MRGVIDDRLKYIDLPIPELYDLSADPREANNLAAVRDVQRAEDVRRQDSSRDPLQPTRQQEPPPSIGSGASGTSPAVKRSASNTRRPTIRSG